MFLNILINIYIIIIYSLISFDNCWLYRGVGFNGWFFSVSPIRCLVYMFYIIGGLYDLVPYIPILATTKEIRKCLFTCFLYKFSLKCLCLRVIIIVRTGFYVKIEVRSLLILLTFNRTSQGIKHRIIG